MMEGIYLFYFALLGAATGLLSGLLGLGGGVFVVPSLYLIFQFLPLPKEKIMHLAIGTSLATMILSSLVSAWVHHLKKAVLWEITKKTAPMLFLGSVLGTVVVFFLSTNSLADIFGFFALLLAAYSLMPKRLTWTVENPSSWILHTLGGGIGFLSSLLGIGGGTVAVPFLMAFHLPVRNAIATSSSFTVFTACVGTVGYLFVGLSQHIPYSFGFIYLPAFIVMSIATTLAAPLGVKLAHLLSPKILKLLYGVSLAIVAIAMIFY